MKKNIYDSVVSKLAIVNPLFSKTIVDLSIKNRGYTVETITPLEFKILLEQEIVPKLSIYTGKAADFFFGYAGTICFDSKNNIISCNSYFKKMFSFLSIDGNVNCSIIFNTLVNMKILKKFEDVINSEIREIFINETNRYLNISICPILDSSNTKYMVVAVIQDITLKKSIENEVTVFAEEIKKMNTYLEHEISERIKNEERFKHISMSMSDWIWEIDSNQKFIYVSEKIIKILGYLPSEVIGKTPFDLMKQDDVQKNKEILLQLISENKPINDFKNWMLSKNGELVCLLTNGFPIFSKDGDILGYRGVNRDITRRIRDKEEKEKMQQQVLHNAKLANIGELAASVAHEINNPLAILSGNLEILKSNLEKNNVSKDLYESIMDVQANSIDRIVEIVNGLRIYSRSPDNKTDNLNINAIITDSIKLLKSIYKKNNIELQTSLDAKKCTVIGNAGKFQQVIMNFITNAKDAIEENKTQKGNINITTKSDDINLFIEISDNGCGIKKEDITKIFDNFYTTKSVGKGTGLGMGIIQSILSQMNGIICVDSEPGVGTKFSIRIPLLLDNNTTTLKKLSGRVLIVDDESEIREILKHHLEKFGLDVFCAENGKNALELLLSDSYSLIITDLQMPNMSGAELIEEIHKLNKLKIKVVVISGNVNTNDIPAHIDGIIQKPFDKENLYLTISNLLKK